MNKVDIVLFVAGSGSGKDYLKDYLLDNFNDHYIDAISTTTRKKRIGEIEGVNYHYVSKNEFDKMKLNDAFIESVSFGDNNYAVSKAEIKKGLSLGKTTILIVEPEGMKQIISFSKDKYNIKIVFIDYSQEQLIKNMKSRGDTDDMIKKRIEVDNISSNMNYLINSGEIVPDLIIKDFLPIKELADKVNRIVFNKQAIIFTGPSGTGKSTLEEDLVENYDFKTIKSYTTRSKRDGENDEVYHFTDIDTFNSLDLFNIIHISDTWKYGTSINDIYSDKHVFSVIDVEFAIGMKNKLESLGYYVCIVSIDLDQETRKQLIADRKEDSHSAKLRFEREKELTILEQFQEQNIEPQYSFVGLGKTKTEYNSIILG